MLYHNTFIILMFSGYFSSVNKLSFVYLHHKTNLDATHISFLGWRLEYFWGVLFLLSTFLPSCFCLAGNFLILAPIQSHIQGNSSVFRQTEMISCPVLHVLAPPVP